MLTADRTIEERWVPRAAGTGPDLWVYRLACGRCLSVIRVEVPEIGASARSEASGARVDVAGPVVARLLERLAAAVETGELAREVAAAAGHPEHRVLLRIPEVLARARSAYGADVRLRGDLALRWPVGPERPSGRLVLVESPPLAGGGLALRIAAGRVLRVLGADGGALLLEPPREDPDLAITLERVEALIAWPDLVLPS